MNIIFGTPSSEMLEKYTVLELDTFRMPDNKLYTSYCVVEKIPLQDFPIADSLKKVHADLIRYYREQQWNYCSQAIEGLTGKWNGELDTFYAHLAERIKQYMDTPPPEGWDGVMDWVNKDPQSVTD